MNRASPPVGIGNGLANCLHERATDVENDQPHPLKIPRFEMLWDGKPAGFILFLGLADAQNAPETTLYKYWIDRRCDNKSSSWPAAKI